MAGAFDALLTGASGGRLSSQEQALRAQILQRWGGYGDWKAADQDQMGDLARVLAANGITDLSKLDFREREYLLDQSGEGGMGKTVEVLYDGRQLDYLGDVNRDGSLGKLAVDRLRADEEFLASKRGDPNEQYWQDFHKSQNGGITNRGDSGAPLLAWSSRGGGNTSFQLVKDPKTGKFVVAPKWGSSSQGDKQAAITAAAIIAGGTYAGLSSAGTTAGLSGLDAAMIDAGAGATNVGAGTVGATAGTTAGTLAPTGLSAVEFGAITPEMLAGSGTAIQGGGMVGGTTGLATGGATAGLSSGGSSATKAALYGAEGYGAGMSGLQTSIFDGVLQATGSTALANGAATVASSGGDWTNWLKTAWDGAGEFLDSGWGKALVTAGGLAMTKDAKQGAPDPMLKEGADGVKDIAKDAKDRAASADEEWNSIFMPRYLGLMDRADRRDQELYDFNMGRARLAARQMDRFYSQVDAYDDEGNRERLAGEAGATAEQNNSAGMEQMRRNIGRMGFNPNSGVMLSQMRQGTQQGALNKTLAMNMAREAARREGLNLRATAAGLRGADSAYAGNAAAGADIGLRGTAAGQQGFSNRNADWRGNMGLGMQGYGQLGSWGLGRSNSADQLNAANVAGWNGLIGYGLGSLWNQPARRG